MTRMSSGGRSTTLTGAAAAAHAATMTGAGEAGARTDRNHVDDAAIAVDDHHLVLHDEEAIVAIGRERVDQRRIGRDRGDGHARRDGDAGANLEVDRARVDMRNVARLQNRLLQRRALLRRHVLAALGLDLAVGRGLALGLTLRVGLALGRVLVGAGVRIPVLSALAGSALRLLDRLSAFASALPLSCVRSSDRCVLSRSDLL